MSLTPEECIKFLEKTEDTTGDLRQISSLEEVAKLARESAENLKKGISKNRKMIEEVKCNKNFLSDDEIDALLDIAEEVDDECENNKGETAWEYEQRRKKEITEQYNANIAKYYIALNDELETAFYKKGTYKSSDSSLQDFKDFLTAINIIMDDKGRNSCESAYDMGRLQMKEDIEKIIKDWKCDFTKFKIGTHFWTGIESELSGYNTFNIRHYEIINIKKYENYLESRTVYEVIERGTEHCTVEDNKFWLFTKEELNGITWDNEEKIKIVEEEHRNTEGSWSHAHKGLFKWDM
jgi:hypothetical protein